MVRTKKVLLKTGFTEKGDSKKGRTKTVVYRSRVPSPVNGKSENFD